MQENSIEKDDANQIEMYNWLERLESSLASCPSCFESLARKDCNRTQEFEYRRSDIANVNRGQLGQGLSEAALASVKG
jgi:hypothetical protein